MSRPSAKPVVHIDQGRIRATEWRFEPGAETGWHIHGHDYTVVPLTDGELLIEEPGGGARTAPLVRHAPYSRMAGVHHNVINNGGQPLSFLEIEVIEDPLQEKRLQTMMRFGDAWNAHDLDTLMACMADDCIFHASSGDSSEGAAHVGREAVRKAYAAVFDTFPDAQWTRPQHRIAGDVGLSTWRFVGRTRDGVSVAVDGCDILHFSGALIALKDSYRKSMVAPKT